MNIEDVFGLIQEKHAGHDNVINLDDEQLLCEISTNSINEWENNSYSWVGRIDLIQHLSQLLTDHIRVLSLVGVSGIGKSSLALRLGCSSALKEISSTLKIISFDTPNPSFDLFSKQILGDKFLGGETVSQADLIEMMLNELILHPCLLILDAAEAIIDVNSRGNSQFWEPRFTEFFWKLLLYPEMRSRIIITSQTAPPQVLFTSHLAHVEYIHGLKTNDALLIFAQHNISPNNAIEQLYLQRIIHEYNGHPLALRVIAGEIIEPPYCGDISAYWHDCQPSHHLSSSISTHDDESIILDDLPIIHQHPINLVERVTHLIEQSFERLLQYSTLAALLLCMGATYRYSTERSAWLFLISDYPSSIQSSAFQTLQQRLFIEESHVEHKVLYRLHRMIREVAVDKMYQIIEAEIFEQDDLIA